MTRGEAVVAGTMVRVAKLHEFMLDPAVCMAAERFWMLWRPTAEACVNVIYLIRHGSPELYDAFVHYSLRLEKQLLARLQDDLANQDGPATPLQQRLLSSLPAAFVGADVDPLEVDSTSRADWSGRGGICNRFKSIGWAELYVLFQIASNYTHGNWHDLSVHHLGEVPGIDGYQPALHPTPLRPEGVTGIARLLSAAAHAYLLHVVEPGADRDVLADRIAFCGHKAEQIDELHERWMVKHSIGIPAA